MNKLKTFDYFNKVANTWLEDLEAKNEEDILINPFEGSWSISELYDHIMKVARTYQIQGESTAPNTTLAQIEFSNETDFGVFEITFADNSNKILFTKSSTCPIVFED